MKVSATALQAMLLTFSVGGDNFVQARLGRSLAEGEADPVPTASPSNSPDDSIGMVAASSYDSYTLPYLGGCDLGHGFDLNLGCHQYSTPFDTTTWTVVNNDPSCNYGFENFKTLASSKDIQAAMSTVSKAEGSYSSGTFKAKASASVSYMTSKEISTNSVSYFLGQTQVVNMDYIKLEDSNLKLTESAMNTLAADPDSFHEQYGPYFVKKIYKGATFSGSLSIYQSTYSDSFDLSAYASIDAKNVFWSAKGSEEYQKAYNETGSELSFEFDGQYTGTSGIVQVCQDCTASDPSMLGDAYDSWIQQANDPSSASRMKMEYANWKEIPQVAEFINTLSNSDKNGKYKNICYPPIIEPQTLEDLNNEAMQTYYIKKALEQTKEYQCYTNGGDVATQIDEELQAATDHYNTFNYLAADEIVNIQDNTTAADNFYIAASMQDQYNELIADNPTCSKIDCNAYCHGYGAPYRKEKVLVDGADFQKAVAEYIKDPESSSYGNRIGCWDVSVVTDMQGAFNLQDTFNEPLNCWDVSNVKKFAITFQGAALFNQDLDMWDTSKANEMSGMFFSAGSFNGDVSTWDTSKVTSMYGMFKNAKSFNQNIRGWNTGKVESTEKMFQYATSFNQDVSSWDVGSVSNMDAMFIDAHNFNQNLCTWKDVVFKPATASMFKGSGCTNPENPTDQAWCQKCS